MSDSDRQTTEIVQQFVTGQMTRRQFIVRLSALGLSVSAIGAIVAACSSSATSAPATAAPATAAPATAAPASAGGGNASLSGTVKYYKGPFAANEADLEATMVASFNQKFPNVKVVVEQFDWPSSAQQITASLGSASHDVYYMPEDLYYQFAAAGGQLQDLTSYVSDPAWKDEYDQINFWEIATAAGTPPVGVPYIWLVESHLFYNQDLFDKAGIGSDWNSSYEKLRETAMKLTTGDVIGMGLRSSGGANYGKHDWYGMIQRAGTDYLDADMKKAAINTPEAAQSIQFFADMFTKDKCVPEFGKYTWTQLRDLFIAGKSAIACDETTFATTINGANPKPTFKWAMAAWPPGPKNQAQFTYRGVLTMNAKSQNKDAAWEMIKHWSSGPVEVPYCDATSIPSVRKDAVSKYSEFKNNPQVAATLDPFSKLAKGPQATPKFQQFMTLVDPLVDQCYQGTLKATDAMAQAEKAINDAMSS
jgi:multiple sugar transport system substrate-binding protein